MQDGIAQDNSGLSYDAAAADGRRVVILPTTLSHRIFVLVSCAFIFFEILFLWLYSDHTWLSVDLPFLTIPAVAVALAASHLFLSLSESSPICRIFSAIGRGQPLLVYRRWIILEPQAPVPALTFGARRIVCPIVDQLHLTFFGNLVFKSRLVCGGSSSALDNQPILCHWWRTDSNPADVLLTLPFNVAAPVHQRRLVEYVQTHNPKCVFNERLKKKLFAKEIKGATALSNFLSILFFFFLFDVGYATFLYLTILKEYYLCQRQTQAQTPDMKLAQEHYAAAENLRCHPLPVSLAAGKLMNTIGTRGGVASMRADALIAMNKQKEAIAVLKEALLFNAKNCRLNLKLARLLCDQGRPEEALQQIRIAIDQNRDALVPRMYNVALSRTLQGDNAAEHLLTLAKSDFDERLFGEKPYWPPDIAPFFPDVWQRDDVVFVFEHLTENH